MSRDLTWFNWADSEPNNGGVLQSAGDENYVVAYGSENWKWGDQEGGKHSAEVICEYEVWPVNGKSKRQILVIT